MSAVATLNTMATKGDLLSTPEYQFYDAGPPFVARCHVEHKTIGLISAEGAHRGSKADAKQAAAEQVLHKIEREDAGRS